MTPPGTFDRVYTALRQRLLEGWYRPGDRLEPAHLSDELLASVTPVRDALHRLTGERLVEAPRQEGFRVPMLTEALLRHLYAWHLDLLLLAIARKRLDSDEVGRIGAAFGNRTLPERQEALFEAIGRLASNPEHHQALRAIRDRIAAVELIEGDILDEAEAETREIAGAIEERDQSRLRAALIRYHRRRQRAVPDLLDELHRREPPRPPDRDPL